MDLELAGKAALVTGGSKGIGKAIALGLAREGADVAVCARNKSDLEMAAKELSETTGRKVLPIETDVSVLEQVDSMVAQVVSTLGRLDILVNNAGHAGGLALGPLPTVTDEGMMEDLNTKFMGYLRCARAAAPIMEKQGWGRIVNIGGLSARSSGSYSGGVRNIAIVHLSKTLADELGPSGITVNVIHPGPTRNTGYVDNLVNTRAQRQGVPLDEAERAVAQSNSIRRLANVEEIANLALFLASPKSGAVTGEVIAAGGGTTRAVYA